MTEQVTLSNALLIADLLGVFFFAESGALLAARRRFDLVGSVLLALLAGLGGGIFRDLVLDQGVPNAFAQPVYLAPVALAVILVYTKIITPSRWRRTILTFDAAGLALFIVSGTQIAYHAGVHPVSCALLGTASGVLGGLLRDISSIQVPSLFEQQGVYAIPAFLGASVTSALLYYHLFSIWAALAIILVVFSFRLLGVRYNWRMPGSVLGQNRTTPLTQPIPTTHLPR